jgi:regulator of cell morphogenesis and NO signaling
MHRQDWLKLSAEELLEFIEQDHHRIREKMSELQTLLQQSTGRYSDTINGILVALREFLPTFKIAMEKHFASEEQLLIPYIRQMDEFDRGIGPKPEFHRSSIKNPISMLESEHDQTENVMFKRIHIIISGYHSPTDSGDSLVALFDGMKEVKTILSEHIHIEHTVLFPLAIEMELRLMHKK